jgi:hypothetical protein
VLVLSYLALIPGFLPAFILGAVLGLVLLVPMLAIAVASWLLLLPLFAVRRLAHHPRDGNVAGDSASRRSAVCPRSRRDRGFDQAQLRPGPHRTMNNQPCRLLILSWTRGFATPLARRAA